MLHIALDTKQVILGMLFPDNLLASTEQDAQLKQGLADRTAKTAVSAAI